MVSARAARRRMSAIAVGVRSLVTMPRGRQQAGGVAELVAGGGGAGDAAMGGAGGAVVAVGGLADDAAAEGGVGGAQGVGGGPGGVGRCGGIGGAGVTDLRCGLCGGAGGVFPDRVALGPGELPVRTRSGAGAGVPTVAQFWAG